jgi:hypothetical protein
MSDVLTDNLQRLRAAVFERFGQPMSASPEFEPAPFPSPSVPFAESQVQPHAVQADVDPPLPEQHINSSGDPTGTEQPVALVAGDNPKAPFPDLRSSRTEPDPAARGSPVDFFNRSSAEFAPASPMKRPLDQEGGRRAGEQQGGHSPGNKRPGLFRRLLRWIGL